MFGGLSGLNTSQLLEHFRQESWHGQQLDRAGFDRVMTRVMPVLNSQQGRQFLDALFDLFDKDANGRVDWHELSTGLAVLSSGSREDRLRVIFDMFDRDNSGFINFQELTHLVRLIGGHRGNFGAAEQQAEQLMRALDKNRDGNLSYRELEQWQGRRTAVWCTQG